MWITAFDRLTHFHQILPIILTENIEQHPTLVRDRFLAATDNFRVLAITRSANSVAISSAVTKEVKLGHIAAFFRGRQELGLYGRMAPNTFAMAGGGPGPGANPKAARPADPQYWARKTQAENLKNAKLFLQQGLLKAESLNNFDIWMEDIVRSVKSVSLTG